MLNLKDYGDGIYVFDAEYMGKPAVASIHMLVDDGQVAFIDTGVAGSLPNALGALADVGLGVEAVSRVILTHVHLDHAGGAGVMMRQFPNAQLIVHPRGARHMIDPAKLIAGATDVYGPEFISRVYGEVLPIDAARVVEVKDGDEVQVGRRTLVCLDTPGHARHHACYFDRGSHSIFTGDMFGLSYGQLDVGDEQFVCPTTTPTQFDPEAMRSSVERILEREPRAAYLTHYGQLRDVAKAGVNLLRRMDKIVELTQAVKSAGADRAQQLERALTDYLLDEVRKHGSRLSDAEVLDVLETDITLNVQGLVYWLDSGR